MNNIESLPSKFLRWKSIQMLKGFKRFGAMITPTKPSGNKLIYSGCPSDNKQNICSGFLICPYKGCPHIRKHSTSYYYNGHLWINCRELPCNERLTFFNGTDIAPSEEHTCIEVKEDE